MRVALLALAGCGRFGFTELPSSDAALPMWGTPQHVGELDDPGEDADPTLTDDLVEIYFMSDLSRHAMTFGLAAIEGSRPGATDRGDR